MPAPQRGNPLYRATDRIERIAVRLAVLAFVAVIPLAIYLTSSVHDSVRAESVLQAETKSKVDAVLLQDPEGAPAAGEPGAKRFVAEASWQTGTGQTHRGTIEAEYADKAGDTISTWIDTSGKATTPPQTPADADVAATLAGIGLTIGGALLVGGAFLFIRSRLNRTRMSHWDLQWETFEPVWSGRSKSA